MIDCKKPMLCVKRTFDIACSSIGLVLLSPLFLASSVAIKVSSEGSVFFLQERLGKDGKPFKIIKFRTMVTDAEKQGDGLFVYKSNDERITNVGRLLRKTSIDELPQLVNVLRGDMSIVGPRPPVVYFPYEGYENYPVWAKKRFTMKPGITGLAQVRMRTNATWNERIHVDNEYVDGFSLWLDAKIIIKSFAVVLNAKNIYPDRDFQMRSEC